MPRCWGEGRGNLDEERVLQESSEAKDIQIQKSGRESEEKEMMEKLTMKEAVENIRNHILCGDHSDGIIAPILNWCDKALADYDESPKMKEAMEIRKMPLQTPMAKMFAEALASDLEDEDRVEKSKCAKYRAALKQIIQFDQDMNDAINRSGYATGGEAGHYFYKAVKVAKEALA